MLSFKKIIAIIVSYLAVFVGTVIIFGFIQNSGTVSGTLQNDSATLPLLYVRAGGSLINEMHGYTEAVDAGYYRDTMTPVDESRAVNLVINEYKYNIVSASYKLYDDQDTDLVEEGSCSDIEKADTNRECQINFSTTLKSNREYCLHVILRDSSNKEITYYTRVRYGSDLKIAEKLKFILDFNEKTFSKDNNSTLANYLESSATTSASDFSYTDLHSSVDDVTWGDMQPSRTSDIAVCLKEINTETASFVLEYNIESKADNKTTYYKVTEYYRLRIGDDKIYLLDYQRTVNEQLDVTGVSVADGAIRLGVGDGSDASLVNYGTADQQYSYVCRDDSLFVYDSTNSIMTSVFKDNDTTHSCAFPGEKAIKVIHADPNTGDLYFVVYGYMHEGSYEGQEGALFYHFSYKKDMLEELLFVPYHRGFEQLKEGISKLAYMSDDNMIYFMIENCIYKFNPSTSHLETAWDNIEASTCAVSDNGVIALLDSPVSSSSAGESLRVIDLNTSSEQKIDEGDLLVTPLGYVGSDLVYGTVDRKNVAEDSTGTVCVPVSEVHIVDKNLKELKTYKSEGDFIMRTGISGNMISFALGKAVKSGSYTDYDDDGDDYIIHNVKAAEQDITITSTADKVRGLQYYLKLKGTSSLVPVAQTARQLDPGYDITKEYKASSEIDLCYYVYTRGRLDVSFAALNKAIDYGNEYAGTIMTSRKHIVWQRAGRAYIWDLGIDSIGKAKKGAQNKTIIDAIASYEGWDAPDTVDNNEQLFAAMTDKLPAETVNLTGIALTDVLHFVYRDRVVVAKTGTGSYCLITGYTNTSVTVADVEAGTVSALSWTAAEEEFKNAGNVFYSYFD